MAKLFDDKLLKDFSALGVREKKSFVPFVRVQELVWLAINLTYSTEQGSVENILRKMGHYMKYATQRMYCKAKKTSKTIDGGVEDVETIEIPANHITD